MGNNTQAKPLPEWAMLVRALRKQLGETQEQFGKRFGVTQVSVSLWESGDNEPPAKVLVVALRGKV